MTTYDDTSVAIGGLMRCCTETIYAYIDAHPKEEVVLGLELDCAYEAPGNKRIIVGPDRPVWRWNVEGDVE